MSNSKPDYKGAQFYKCALQVNPYTYSSDYRGDKDPVAEGEYNEAILQQCLEHEIKVVGLADHGNVESSESLRQLLMGNGRVVFPGFEIASSEKIQMVCLYPEGTSIGTLNRYLGALTARNVQKLEDKKTYPSSKSCQELSELLRGQNGFWYAAHMTHQNGLLRLTRAGDNYMHLWREDGLVVAGQIPGSIEDLDVAREDLEKYRGIIENKNPDYKRNKPIAIINAKDVAKPQDLGEASASCQIKMTEPNFEAFKQAFHDPESRIRLNRDKGGEALACIEYIRWEGGGFFHECGAAFSKSLNAVIGGRGTGKSTLMESIRYVLDLPYRNDSRDTAVRLDKFRAHQLQNTKITVGVKSRAQNGQSYTISRRYGEQPQVFNAGGEISHLIPGDILPQIDLIGQNEILDIAQSQDAKRNLVERFLPDNREQDNVLGALRDRLKQNRERYVRAEEQYEKLQTQAQQEPLLKERQRQFQSLGIEDKLKNVQSLARENAIREQAEAQFATVKEWLGQYQPIDTTFLSDRAIGALPNKDILVKIKAIIEELNGVVEHQVQDSQKALGEAQSKYGQLAFDWRKNSDSLRDELNAAIGKLPQQEGKSGQEIGEEYQMIIRQIEQIRLQAEARKNLESNLEHLKKERDNLVEEYREAAFSRCDRMLKASNKCNRGDLKGKVKISVSRCGDLKELREFLLKMGGIGEQKIKWLDKLEGDKIDIKQWSEWVRERSPEEFLSVYGEYGMPKSVADGLCALSTADRLRMEEIELEDKVDIRLNVSHGDQPENYIALDNLSTGQKCTAILNLLLVSCDDPLVIDQPEDNLDNAFIADRIVKDIRRFKANRQFLFTTHNANIPVFGDAELIIVLSSASDGGEIRGRVEHEGSIDKPAVQEQAASILEGGREAFNDRKAKYGF